MLWEEELPGSVTYTKFEIHRLKGRIHVRDGKVLLLQGVRNVYELTEGNGGEGEGRGDSKLVLIGRGVEQEAFRESLLAVLEG